MHRAITLGLAAVCWLSAGSAVHADQIYNFSASPQVSFTSNSVAGLALMPGTTSGTMPTSGGAISVQTLGFGFGGQQQLSMPVSLSLGGSSVTVGTLYGSLGSGGTGLSFTPNGSIPSVTLGGTNYTFSATFTPSSLDGLPSGMLTVNVTDPPTTTGGGTTSTGSGSTASTGSTPEPSSLLLAAFGIPLLGLFGHRRAARKQS
jgi:hypothetical protein